MKSKKTFVAVIYSIADDNKSVKLVETMAALGSCKESWDAFSAKLNGEYANSPVYAAFDFTWAADDGHDAGKLLFVTWVPDTAPIKKKMLTTSTKEAVKRALVGIGQDFQCTDASENTYECALDKCKSATTSG